MKLSEKKKGLIREVLTEAYFKGVDAGKYSEWDGISVHNLGPDDMDKEDIDPFLHKIIGFLEGNK